MKGEVIVFAPHPDDETWGCGGTIAKKRSEGHEVLIVVMTDGRYAFLKMLGIDSDPTPNELKNIRREEVRRATRILGVPDENLFFLDFVDGTLENFENEAEESVIKILRRNSPVEVYFPYEKDSHPDHKVTNRIVRKAIRRLGLSPLKYQYSIAQTYARIGPIIDALLNLFRHKMIRVDISEFSELKKAAMAQFESEISIISRRQKSPLIGNLNKFKKNKETFYIDK